jgi:peptidoglycan/xylan/chitin deacetylase (PgdA/CDA1 family)
MKRFKRAAISAICFIILPMIISGGVIGASAKITDAKPAGRYTETAGGTDLTILMYHDVSNRRPGKYVISPRSFEQDVAYLKDNGYESITLSDLICFKEDCKPIPEKPVMITFDDGSRATYTHAFPILKKYGFKAVVSVVGAFIDAGYDKNGNLNPKNNSSLTYEQIKEMHRSGLVEFQNHSYDLHSFKKGRNGLKPYNGENPAHYERVLSSDLAKTENALEKNAGIRCNAVAFPFGEYTKETIKIIRNLGYKASLTCNEGVNRINGDSDLYLLKRYNRDNNRPAKTLMKNKNNPGASAGSRACGA